MKVLGVIESFDDHRGDGILRSDEGERFYFHCVAIANGTRHIDAGVRAEGQRRVGHVGRDEVTEVTQAESGR